jgi:ribonuclease HI
MNFIVYTDGGSRGNPGPAGIGFVIKDGENTLKEGVRFIGIATNNVAEYTALIDALTALKKIIPTTQRKTVSIEVRMDSELIVKQLTGIYQVKEETLHPFFIMVWNLRVQFPHLTFVHIPRTENARADALANEAMDQGLR